MTEIIGDVGEMAITPAVDAGSWIYALLFLIFILVCFRMRGNLKFASTFFSDLLAVRDRSALFAPTMRETSLIFLLLLLAACSGGVLLREGAEIYGSRYAVKVMLPAAGWPLEGEFAQTAVCMGLGCAYIGGMWFVYNLVGTVFTDSLLTWQWVRGFTSGMGLASVLLFPLALIGMVYTQWQAETVIVALAVLILVKILFIIKGFRIFFAESSSWVVFLYYLCSLEIIPLVITFGIACKLPG